MRLTLLFAFAAANLSRRRRRDPQRHLQISDHRTGDPTTLTRRN